LPRGVATDKSSGKASTLSSSAALPYYFVVTNEFGPARLKKVLDNQCKNGLFHVNRALLLKVHDGNGRLSGIEDLTDLFRYFE